MILYGTAVLAVCLLVGKALGGLLGLLVGVDADVGGVGFAMILLLFASGWMRSKGLLPKPTERGMLFWSGMYIPIVVAMAAIQNVKGALTGGPMAITAGLAATAICMALIPAIAKIGAPSEPLPPLTAAERAEED
ncbi:MAG: malonate transporter subunit MadL [Propionibacteriales bacterium]|nr:malonate transporter subunit MadL [Kocuria sp.]MDN5724684.1 malonate transporter subunit MadL [Propionibacteriales bacterium]